MKRVLDDITIFCAVVETGSLKRASQQLSIPHSTVSRRIEALESNLGLTLLHRTTRDVQVSSRGQALYEDCVAHLNNIQHSIKIAIDDEVEFRGKLSISMPVKAGIDFLGAWLIDFQTQHPELNLDISLSNDNKNLIKDEVDLAFRVGPLVDSGAIALKLWDIPYALCCHRSFLAEHHITSTKISEAVLATLPAVVSRPAVKWAFVDKHQQDVSITPNTKLTVDDLGLAYHAMQSGKFIAMLPVSMIQHHDIATVSIAHLQTRTRKMYAYYLGRRHAQSQIKHLVEYVRAKYTKAFGT